MWESNLEMRGSSLVMLGSNLAMLADTRVMMVLGLVSLASNQAMCHSLLRIQVN